MDFSKLLSLSYVFDTTPPPAFAFVYQLATLFALCIIAALVIQLLISLKKGDQFLRKHLKRAPAKLYSLGVVGLLLLFFRYEGAPYLSMRAWLYLWALFFLIWLIRFILGFKKVHDARRYEIENERLKRYQP